MPSSSKSFIIKIIHHICLLCKLVKLPFGCINLFIHISILQLTPGKKDRLLFLPVYHLDSLIDYTKYFTSFFKKIVR